MTALTTKRQPLAQLVFCQGCCCGRTDRDQPELPVEMQKGVWKAEKLNRSVQLTISGCLGPCDLANVALAANIAVVARSFLAQFDATEASLRVEVAATASCPKFHCDNIRARVVTTYHGPGTEYVFAATPDDIRRGPTGALMFLKGHKHPTHADAVLHRSPMVPHGEKRLCVVLDV